MARTSLRTRRYIENNPTKAKFVASPKNGRGAARDFGMVMSGCACRRRDGLRPSSGEASCGKHSACRRRRRRGRDGRSPQIIAAYKQFRRVQCKSSLREKSAVRLRRAALSTKTVEAQKFWQLICNFFLPQFK